MLPAFASLRIERVVVTFTTNLKRVVKSIIEGNELKSSGSLINIVKVTISTARNILIMIKKSITRVLTGTIRATKIVINATGTPNWASRLPLGSHLNHLSMLNVPSIDYS